MFRSFALSSATAAAGGDPFGRSVLFQAGGTLRIAFPLRRISPHDGAPPPTGSAPLPSWDRETPLAPDPAGPPHTGVAGQECLPVSHTMARAADSFSAGSGRSGWRARR